MSIRSKRGEIGLEIIVGIVAVIVLVSAVPFIVGSITDSEQYLPGVKSDVEAASFIIFKDDSGETCAKNGTSGRIEQRSIDSTIIIQHVIDSCNGTIFINPGIYEIDSSIYINNSVRLVGNSETIISITTMNTTGFYVYNQNCVIEGITIHANGQTQDATVGISVHAPYTNILGVQIIDAGYMGIHVLSAGYSTHIENCRINMEGTYEHTSIVIDGSYTHVTNCIMTGGRIGVTVSATGLVVSNNQIHDVSECGIYSAGTTSKNIIISSNTIYNTGSDGINIYAATNVSIVGNNVHHAKGDSIICDHSDGVTITGNVASDPVGYTGLYPTSNCVLVSSHNVTITGNRFSGSNNHGIGITSSSYVVITSNMIVDSQDNGVGMWSYCSYITINSNTIVNSGKGGDPANSAGVGWENCTYIIVQSNTIVDNQGTNTTQHGVYESSTSDYALVIDNLIHRAANATYMSGAHSIARDNYEF